MLLDVLIPSNGQLSKLQSLLESISWQTLQPDRVLILIHKPLKKEEQETLLYFLQRSVHPELSERIVLLTNLTAEYEPWKWVAHDRNVLLAHAKAKFVWMIDHDNVFKSTLFAQMATFWMQRKEEFASPVVCSPTILWRQTQKIQSQWITWFSYLIPKFRYKKMHRVERQKVLMVGWNSLFGLLETFQQFPFDTRFSRCYEDVDMTYRVQNAGIPVLVSNKIEINHMESTKNRLQTLFLWDVKTAYERARNRIWFVKKNANLFEKVQYFCCGVRLQTLWFFWNVLVYGGKDRTKLMKAVWNGTRDGLMK